MNAGPPHVVIPFGTSDPDRVRALEHVRATYAGEGLRVVVADAGGDPWSKGASIDAAVRESGARLLVVADADVIVPTAAVARSVAAVRAGAAWSQPHSVVVRLTPHATTRVLSGMPWRRQSWQWAGSGHSAPHGGGIVVLGRDSYDASGGMDPRFVGWGGDDVSWARALDTLAGPCARLRATMLHLWHPPQPRLPGNRASAENELLAARYIDANGDPDAMRELVRSRP